MLPNKKEILPNRLSHTPNIDEGFPIHWERYLPY